MAEVSKRDGTARVGGAVVEWWQGGRQAPTVKSVRCVKTVV